MPVKNMNRSPRLGLLRNMNPEKSRVRRNLFGTPDHNELKKDLELQLKQTQVDMKSTWNFDPTLDEPLDGRYEWTVVEKDEYVPECYRKGYVSKFARRRLTDIMPVIDLKDLTPPSSPEPVSVESRLSGLTDSSDSDNEADAIALRRENETTPEARLTTRQPKINEFMRIKKRRLSDEDLDLEARPSKSSRNAL
ncbi:cyclin-dependent protein serine/threonine kinase inhibitor [Mactra antiquata]